MLNELGSNQLTETTVPERHIALRGILKRWLTRIHREEYGKALSRDTAQSVRDAVVAFPVRQPKKQNANRAISTEAAALEPVP